MDLKHRPLERNQPSMIQVLDNADLFGGKAAIHNAFGPKLNRSDSIAISIAFRHLLRS